MVRTRAGRQGGKGKPVTFDEVVAIAGSWPAVEESTSYGTRALKVKGKLFARLREDGETLVVRSTMVDRDLLMQEWPAMFYLTDHYRDYPYVLVRLGAADRVLLAQVLEDSWHRAAPPAVRKLWKAG